jgi:hypothetical protein
VRRAGKGGEVIGWSTAYGKGSAGTDSKAAASGEGDAK